ncbi:hypothetical protein H9P43_001920 [Blastocladiella emersonii ATCC 22665]|nr:hypothetical protein H9P43_001920 [Blastocladiella emersonii ATCC 22665]
MSNTNNTNGTPANGASSASRGGRGGGSARGGGGGRPRRANDNPAILTGDGNGRGGRGSGRGGRGGGRGGAAGPRRGGDANVTTSTMLNGQALDVNIFLASAKPTAARGNDDEHEEDDGDAEGAAESCFICTEEMVYSSVGPCNHRTCHVCTLRMRALYKDFSCPFCKAEMDEVVVTKNHGPAAEFEAFVPLAEQPYHDAALKLWFDSQETYAASLSLLRYHCPDPQCTFVHDGPGGWNGLKSHVHKTHGHSLCDICIGHKLLFAHEHTLYPADALRHHREHGDLAILDRVVNPDDSVVKGHPACGFCQKRFYGNDELYAHCRERHEECFLCQRDGIRNVYYRDYAGLEDHFDDEHWPCNHQECIEAKFVVFASEIDLKAHMSEVHGQVYHPGGGRQRAHANHARRIDTAFTVVPSSSSASSSREASAAGNRRGKNRDPAGSDRRGGGRDAGAAASSSSASASATAASQGEAAAAPKPKRERKKKGAANDADTAAAAPTPAEAAAAAAASSSSSASSASPPPAAAPVGPGPAGRAVPGAPPARMIRPPPGFGNLTRAPVTASASAPATAAAESREAAEDRAIKSSPVLTQLYALLDQSRPKLREFQSMSSAYMSSAITAAEFVTALTALLADKPRAQLDSVLDAVIATCPNNDKRHDLNVAVRDRRAPPAPRVLVIRNTSGGTSPRGSRSNIASAANPPSWSYILPQNRAVRANTAKNAAGGSSVWNVPDVPAVPVPVASAVAAAAKKNKGKAAVRPVSSGPWAAGSAAAAAAPAAAAARPASPMAAASSPSPPPKQKRGAMAAPVSAADYPSLPSSASASPIVGLGWGQSAAASSASSEAAEVGGKGKGKKGKQILFRVGL